MTGGFEVNPEPLNPEPVNGYNFLKPTWLPEVNLINPCLLGERCKTIIIRDADKALHFLFPRTLIDLT